MMVKATKLATVDGIALYEHPIDGDEAPMMFKWGNGYVCTGLYNEPDVDPVEVREAYEALKAATGGK